MAVSAITRKGIGHRAMETPFCAAARVDSRPIVSVRRAALAYDRRREKVAWQWR